MKFSIAPEIFTAFPDSLCGVIVFTDVNNRTKSKEPYALLKQVIKEKSKEDISKHPTLTIWKKAFEKVGMNPNKFPPSIAALAKRIASKKDLPSINPVVDLYNAVSIKTMNPMGGHDLDTIQSDVEVRMSKKGDTFVPLGKETPEEIEPGYFVFATKKTVICDKWAWKQSNIQKITPKTRNFIMRIEGLDVSKEDLQNLMEELASLIHKYCGGKSKNFILGKANPSVNLGLLTEGGKERKLSKKDKAIDEILNRGTVDVIVREELEKKLRSGKKLRVKLGIDPTGSDIHLGHMVPVKKLREFQKLGHHIILLFGNFTGQIGDPTGKDEVRNKKTQKELEKNAKTYIKQVSKVLDVNKIEVVWNADWLSKLSFADVVHLSSLFTVSQMLERDMYQERMKKKRPIYVHEFMYPLMQGYDSVPLKADVELGGTDQTFNLLAGRTIQKAYGQKPQSVITVPILEGLDGHIKMGKTTGNYVGVMEEGSQQYGKIMSIPDELILRYFELATEVPMSEIDKIQKDLKKGMNPRDAKMRLAREIVTLYHGEKEAKKAEESFKKIFQKGGIPDKMPSAKLKKGHSIIQIMIDNKMVTSSSEARRMLQQNAVCFDDEKITDIDYEPKGEGILKVGKRRFLRIQK